MCFTCLVKQLILDIEQQFKEKKKLIEAEEKELAAEELATFLEKELGIKELTLEEEKSQALKNLEELNGNETQRLAIIKKFADEEVRVNDEVNKAKLNKGFDAYIRNFAKTVISQSAFADAAQRKAPEQT